MKESVIRRVTRKGIKIGRHIYTNPLLWALTGTEITVSPEDGKLVIYGGPRYQRIGEAVKRQRQ